MMEDGFKTVLGRANTSPMGSNLLNTFWRKVAIILNDGEKLRKTASGWRHYWNELKFRARKKARDHLKYVSGSGPYKRPLNNFEARVVALVGIEGSKMVKNEVKKNVETQPLNCTQLVPLNDSEQSQIALNPNVPKPVVPTPAAPNLVVPNLVVPNPEKKQEAKQDIKIILIEEDEDDIIEVPIVAAIPKDDHVQTKPKSITKKAEKRSFLINRPNNEKLEWTRIYAEKRHILDVRKVQALERIGVALEVIADRLVAK